MRTLLYFGFLGWFCLISWGLFLWWKTNYTQAYATLKTLSIQQARAIQVFPEQTFLKPWSIKPQVNLNALQGTPKLQAITVEAIHKGAQFLNLVIVATQCLLIKLVILLTAIPLLSVTALVGVVDGLSQRAIRTACLGRESSYLFHQLKRHSKKGLSVFIAFWLLVPLSITPALVFIPMSLLMGLLTAVTVSHFKKYY